MKSIKLFYLAGIAIGLSIAFATNSDVSAQGKSAGKSKGRPTTTAGSSQRGAESRGGQQTGRNETVSRRDVNRTDRGRLPDDNEIKRFGGIAKKLDTTPEALRSDYRAALAANPDLKFGQYVAANVIADNLKEKHPEITASSILLGLENGDSIGRTLKNLGLSGSEAKKAQKQAKRQLTRSEKQNRSREN